MLSVLETCDADSDVSVVCALLHHVDKTDTEPETGNTLGARPPETRGPGGERWAATPGGGGPSNSWVRAERAEMTPAPAPPPGECGV